MHIARHLLTSTSASKPLLQTPPPPRWMHLPLPEDCLFSSTFTLSRSSAKPSRWRWIVSSCLRPRHLMPRSAKSNSDSWKRQSSQSSFTLIWLSMSSASTWLNHSLADRHWSLRASHSTPFWVDLWGYKSSIRDPFHTLLSQLHPGEDISGGKAPESQKRDGAQL